jgi:FHA domain-containing protein
VFKLLTLTAKAFYLSGEHSEVQGTFDASEVSIGRQAECDLVLPDPDRRISRMQARILRTNGQYVVYNTSTSNPMYVNGVELSSGSSQVITDGDELRAGSYVVAVSLAGAVSRQQQNRSRTAATLADADLQNDPSGEGIIPANADPLLVLGSSTDTSLESGANPFADLLVEAAPTNNALDAGQDTGQDIQSAQKTPLPTTANESLPDKRVAEKSLPARRGNSEMAPIPAELPPAEQKPLNIPHAIKEGASVNPLSVEPGSPPTWAGDPNDPFGDILGKALPIGSTDETVYGKINGARSASRQDANVSSAEQHSEHVPLNFLAPPSVESAPLRQPDTPSGLKNPFELPADLLSAPRAPKGTGHSDMSALAGDPFADLMGPPVESHMANAPPFAPMAQGAAFIPEDFNPLAAGGVSQRNSSDPLTPMGRNAKGLADVMPKSTIDSIYNPGGESPTMLAVDPLQQIQERGVLSVRQGVDPLKLFENKESGLLPDKPEANTSEGSVRDDAREMVAAFRAPIPRMDPDMLAAQAVADVPAVPPEPNSRNQPAPVAGWPSDSEANITPAVEPVASTVDTENGTSVSLPPSPAVDPAHQALPDATNSELEQNSTQSGDVAAAQQLAPESSVIPPPVITNPSSNSPSVETGKSEIPDTQTLMAAFKRGSGLEEWSATSVTPELMEMLGRLLQTAAQGAVSLLAARAAIKQEIHLSVTLINPKSNNPLKFLPDGHTALLQMLGPKMPGFMVPVDAMKEAFDDLLIHQTAIAAGTQAAIEALFRRFDPDVIESDHPKNGMMEKLSQTKHDAKLWGAYTRQYRLIREEIKDDFFKRLGAEFHNAYNREYDQHTDDER